MNRKVGERLLFTFILTFLFLLVSGCLDKAQLNLPASDINSGISCESYAEKRVNDFGTYVNGFAGQSIEDDVRCDKEIQARLQKVSIDNVQDDQKSEAPAVTTTAASIVASTPITTATSTATPSQTTSIVRNADFDAGVIYKDVFTMPVEGYNGKLASMSVGVNDDDVYLKMQFRDDFDFDKHMMDIEIGQIDEHSTTQFKISVSEKEARVYERKLAKPGMLGDAVYAPQYRTHLSNTGKELIIGVEDIWALLSVRLESNHLLLEANMDDNLVIKRNLGEPKYGLSAQN